MHQDWRLFAPDLPSVLRTYALDTSPADVADLRSEIEDLLRNHADEIDVDYYRLSPNSAMPSGWNMRAGEWLKLVAQLSADLPRSGVRFL